MDHLAQLTAALLQCSIHSISLQLSVLFYAESVNETTCKSNIPVHGSEMCVGGGN